MSKYYLDTDMLSLLERGNNAIQYHLLKRDPSEVFMTVITFHEQIEGRFKMIDKARTPATLALAYEQFAQTLLYLRDLPVATFNEPAILRYEDLLKMKLNVGKNDLRIAAIVLEANGIVVTRNKRDFGRVPDLIIEDWSQTT